MKVSSICLSVFVFFVCLLAPCVAEAYSAECYCVIDSVTGRILYEKNAHVRRGMASTTKIMTAIVALETANLSDVVAVSYNASRTEGSSLYLKPGDRMTVEDLVYGLMLNSGNDTAVALAEHIGGSVEGFAQMMNDKARQIGANNTCFQNPNGLHSDGHYTTAYDLAIITRYALKKPIFAKIVATKTHKVNVIGDDRTIYLSNHNRLLSQLDGCDGVKTGYTKKTGRCLVSSVTHDGWQAICVTLNAPDDWNDHKMLINRAFEEYKPQKVLKTRQFMCTAAVEDGESDSVRLLAAGDFFIPAKKGEVFELDLIYHVPQTLNAPVGFEQQVGSAEVVYNGVSIGSVGLVSENAVYVMEKPGYWDYLKGILKNWAQLSRY